MPIALSYPGVYIEEVASGVRTITGVPTSIAAFVGRTIRGPANRAITINGFGDFERIFGGLWLQSQLGFAVRDFFLNGGGQAVIVRLFAADLSEADVGKASVAAKAVAAAAVGANAPAAAAAAKAVAITFVNDPEKTAAATVLAAAEKAAAPAAATPLQVTEAALAAVAAAAPAAQAGYAVGGLDLVAASEGRWGANLRVSVNKEGISKEVATAIGVEQDELFNLKVRDARPGGAVESYANLTVKESARRIDRVLLAQSALVQWRGKLDPNTAGVVSKASDPISMAEDDVIAKKKKLAAAIAAGTKLTTEKTDSDAAVKSADDARKQALDAVSDGKHLKATDFLPTDGEAKKLGLYALDQADMFNLLCIPPYATADSVDFDVDPVVVSAATSYCERRRAIHLIDPRSSWTTKDDAKAGIVDFPDSRSKNAVLYFPRLKQPNLLRENRIETFAPCGAVAGVIARTDTQRGVWKAPAGLDATLAGVPQLSVNLTDAENGELNPLGINCLRAFAVSGRVVWGSRTLRGADQLADEWKYLPVRRTALFIEESLYRGTQWVVFEPNDEPLWSQIRLNVGAFMHGLFRQGAFQGQSPRDAYFVKCDKETTTQTDIDSGIVNIAVGFAPLKPAEFVVIRLQQIAGQIQT